MFSVVIPLYNKELSIKNTIQSVLNQTIQDFEIIIVNDGSTDGSIAIVEEFTDSRIKLVHQVNQGVSAARNKGIKEARYQWIAFLDGDDLWRMDHLNEIMKMMKFYPNEKIYATSFEYSDKRQIFRYERFSEISKIEDYFKEALKEVLIWTGIVVVNKKCFDKVGNFRTELSRGEDRDMWARLAKEYRIIKSVKITCIYNVDSENKLTAGRSNLDDSILSVISLTELSGSERAFYKKLLTVRIKSNIKNYHFKETLCLLIKHNIELFR